MFAKIFSQIFDSSIADKPQIRRMFMDLLVLADEDGVVDMTPTAIAARTRLPVVEVSECIAELESPDPMSRTPDFEGRRLVRIDEDRTWGWRITNFRKYRESATKAMLRMAEADRKSAYRARYGKTSSSKPPTPKKSEAEAEAEADKSGTCPGQVPDKSAEDPRAHPKEGSQEHAHAKGRKAGAFTPPTREELDVQAAKIGLPAVEVDKFVSHYASKGWKVGKQRMESWPHAMTGWKIRWEESRNENHSSKQNGNRNSGTATRQALLSASAKAHANAEESDTETSLPF